MKSCFIVNYWADTEEKIEMVINCIKQLKKTGNDVIYTSLYPIDKRISNETNFSIFSNTNELITLFDLLDNNIHLENNVSYDTSDFRFFSIPLNWNGVQYTVHNQLVVNFKMLKSLKYTHCHFFVGDCIISDNELDNFNIIEKSCTLLNKKAYFDDISEKFSNAYSGIYFYSDIDFFINNFLLFKTKEEYTSYYDSNRGLLCFEQILKHAFKNQEKHLLLGNNDSWNLGPLSLFKESKIDIIESFNSKTNYYIIPLELIPDVKDISYIFVTSKEIEPTNFKIYVDDEFEEGVVEYDRFLYLKTNKKQFNLKILKNDVVDFEEVITEKRLKRIHSYAFFDANKRNI